MALHHNYTTDGVVVGVRPHAEASSFISLMTRDFGLISARAQGVREVRSKLRPHVQEMECVAVTLVKGKQGWRITNARSENGFSISPRVASTVARVFRLLTILCAGEEENEALFVTVLSGLKCAARWDEEENPLSAFEHLFVLRILNVLGYVGDEAHLKDFFDYEDWSHKTLESVASSEQKIVKTINQSLKETQM